jgi:hypothetical protein
MTIKKYGDLERRLRQRVVEKSQALKRAPRVTYQPGSDDALDRQAADAIAALRKRITELEELR